MPWLAAETAETLPAGALEGGVGLALLAPPNALDRPLPVPQLWGAVGVRDGIDVAAGYAVPLTFHARAKLRLPDARWGAHALALGGGVHGVPDVGDAGARFWTPFATGALLVSGTARPRVYGAIRVIAPFHPEDRAATAWWVLQGGLELEARRLIWGPEAGVVVPALHPGRPQILVGAAARLRRLP